MDIIAKVYQQFYAMDIIVCVPFALAASLFYKKTFNKQMLPSVILLVLEGCCLMSCSRKQTYVVGGIIAFGIVSGIYLNMKKRLPVKITHFIVFLAVLVEYKLSLFNISYWTRIFAVSAPQFIRRPASLKRKLQEVRAVLGPLYVFFVVTTLPSFDMVSYCLKIFASFAAVIAGTLSRPDNSVLLSAVGVPSSFVRRHIHRYMMISSFLCCTLIVPAFHYFKYQLTTSVSLDNRSVISNVTCEL